MLFHRNLAAGVAALLIGTLVCAQAQAIQHPNLLAGPMPAFSEMNETVIWVQTKKPANVTIRYQATERITYPEKSPSIWVPVVKAPIVNVSQRTGNDDIALVRLTGLMVGSKFKYELLIDKKAVKSEEPFMFQTQPHWLWQKSPSEPPNFKVAIGSCLYINDPQTDRPGKPNGGDYEILDSIRKSKPDLMLWLGDNTYYREMEWLNESGMRSRWRHDRSFAPLQKLLASTHNYATWDDHDFGPNDSDVSFRLKDVARTVFQDYWPAPRYGSEEKKGVYRTFEWGDVQFFFLDDRTFRSPNRWPNPAERVQFGAEQIKWLKEGLVNSRANFKVIASGGQMLNPMTFFEGFGQAPTEQKDLFDFLAAAKISGLVFLSGDRHASELIKVRWPGAAYDWYDFTCSPLTAGFRSGMGDEANNPARIPGTWLGARNFGLLEFSGIQGSRTLKMTTLDKDGKTVWSQEVNQSELRAPAPPRN